MKGLYVIKQSGLLNLKHALPTDGAGSIVAGRAAPGNLVLDQGTTFQAFGLVGDGQQARRSMLALFERDGVPHPTLAFGSAPALRAAGDETTTAPPVVLAVDTIGPPRPVIERWERGRPIYRGNQYMLQLGVPHPNGGVRYLTVTVDRSDSGFGDIALYRGLFTVNAFYRMFDLGQDSESRIGAYTPLDAGTDQQIKSDIAGESIPTYEGPENLRTLISRLDAVEEWRETSEDYSERQSYFKAKNHVFYTGRVIVRKFDGNRYEVYFEYNVTFAGINAWDTATIQDGRVIKIVNRGLTASINHRGSSTSVGIEDNGDLNVEIFERALEGFFEKVSTTPPT